MGRHGLDAGAALHLHRGAAVQRRAAAAALQRVDVRAGADRLRHRGAEEALPAAHRQRSTTGGARASPSPAPAPTSPSLKTTAVREGDHYVVNGQKTWTTLAQYADWIFCLVRTDPSAKKQHGISFLLIDMKTPGITVRPIQTIDGGHEVNEVFFDDVKVPVENLVGEENRAGTAPSSCSATSAPASPASATPSSACSASRSWPRRSMAGDKPLIEDERFREKVAAVEVELKALEMTQMRVARRGPQPQGQRPTRRRRSSRSRAREIQQATTELLLEIAGPLALPYQPSRRRRVRLQRAADRTSTGRRRSRRPISTTARSRSTAAPTRSSATSSPRRCWALTADPLVPSLRMDERRTDRWSRRLAWSASERADMDFDLTDEQRLLKDSVERLLADSYGDFDTRKSYMQRAEGLQRGALAASTPSSACSACRSPRTHGGFGGGADRDHDRDGGVRPGAGARALPRHRRARRRRAAARRQRGAAEGELVPGDRRRQADAGARAPGAAVALRPRRRRDHGHARRQAARCSTARRCVVLARRQRRQADRHGAHLRRARATAAASACSWSTPRPTA